MDTMFGHLKVEEMKVDWEDAHGDALFCEFAIANGVTHYGENGSKSVQTILDRDLKMIAVIEQEMKDRNLPITEWVKPTSMKPWSMDTAILEVTVAEVDNPLFELGEVVITPGAMDLLNKADLDGLKFLVRHVTGDWGVTSSAANHFALKNGQRIVSTFDILQDELLITTEADRSSTTFLLVSEY